VRPLLLLVVAASTLGAQHTAGSSVALLDTVPVARLTRHHAGVVGTAFAPDARTLATAGSDGTICVWNAASWQARWCVRHGAEIYGVVWSPDGRHLATSGGDRRVVQWDARTGAPVHAVTLPAWSIAIAYRPDGVLLAGSVDGWVYSTTRASSVPTRVLETENEILSMAVSPDGRYLATAVPHRIWDLQTRQRLSAPRSFGQGGLAIAPGGRWIAAAEWTGGLRLHAVPDGANVAALRLASPRELFTLSGADTATVNMPAADVAFSHDGRHLAAAGTDFDVWIWAAGDTTALRRPPQRVRGHGATVTRVSFSSDGRYLASGSLDRSVVIWRLR
jgi:WD40 repeat protein